MRCPCVSDISRSVQTLPFLVWEAKLNPVTNICTRRYDAVRIATERLIVLPKPHLRDRRGQIGTLQYLPCYRGSAYRYCHFNTICIDKSDRDRGIVRLSQYLLIDLNQFGPFMRGRFVNAKQEEGKQRIAVTGLIAARDVYTCCILSLLDTCWPCKRILGPLHTRAASGKCCGQSQYPCKRENAFSSQGKHFWSTKWNVKVYANERITLI